jgi:hypothetical protein
MPEEFTIAEIERRVTDLGRRFSDYTRKDVYERDIREIQHDISEIKDSQRWAMRLIAGQFVALVLALLIYVVQRWPN